MLKSGEHFRVVRGAFSLIEVLSGIVVMGVVVLFSIRAIGYLNSIYGEIEMRYLALNRLDSEISRVVMGYENHKDEEFYNDSRYGGGSDWDEQFTIEEDFSSATDGYIVYQTSSPSIVGLNDGSYGLKVSSSRSVALLKNISGDIDSIDDGDIVGLIGWRVDSSVDGSSEISINLTLRYPYIYRGDGEELSKLWSYLESINIETSTRI
ncbi:MAG: hypothetical protein GXO06_00970 [Epsilonproteobacteria bacterium]|nr:hypothetical protein [Campylobacterota bacterium]